MSAIVVGEARAAGGARAFTPSPLAERANFALPAISYNQRETIHGPTLEAAHR